MKLLLHIGSPKTGTTALQRALNLSRRYLAGQGVLYPTSPYNPYKHEILSSGLAGRWRSAPPGTPDGAALDAARIAWLGTVADEVRATRPAALILTSEALFRDATPDLMDRLRNELATLGADEVEVIAYVRQTAPMYLSMVQQRMKASHQILPIGPPRFRGVLTTYARYFGRDRMRVAGFDRHLLEGQDIVTDFVARYLGDFGIDRAALSKPDQTNESLSAEAMMLLRQYREDFHGNRDDVVTRDTQALVRTLQRLDRAQANPRPALRRETSQLIDDLARTDLCWLRDEYGIVYPGYDYAGAGAGVPAVPEALTLDDLMAHDPMRLAALADTLAQTPWARSKAMPWWLDMWLTDEGAQRRKRRDWLRAFGAAPQADGPRNPRLGDGAG